MRWIGPSNGENFQNFIGKGAVISLLLGHLENFAQIDASVNAFLITALVDLKATQALPLIEEAFKAEKVDESVLRWHTVQRDFGLITQEEHDRIEAEFVAAYRAKNNDSKLTLRDFGISANNTVSQADKKKKEKAKAKRKMAKASQKKNRKK